ncbi:MAG: hypothetical protein WCC37_23300 [Candidatus Sulfotelmatobacter sp.]
MTATVTLVKADCLHCAIDAVIKAWVVAHPTWAGRNYIAGALARAIVDFMVHASADVKEVEEVMNSFMDGLPDAMVAALADRFHLAPGNTSENPS